MKLIQKLLHQINDGSLWFDSSTVISKLCCAWTNTCQVSFIQPRRSNWWWARTTTYRDGRTMSTHLHIHSYLHIHRYVYIHPYIHTYIHTYILTYLLPYIYICIFTHNASWAISYIHFENSKVMRLCMCCTDFRIWNSKIFDFSRKIAVIESMIRSALYIMHTYYTYYRLRYSKRLLDKHICFEAEARPRIRLKVFGEMCCPSWFPDFIVPKVQGFGWVGVVHTKPLPSCWQERPLAVPFRMTQCVRIWRCRPGSNNVKMGSQPDFHSTARMSCCSPNLRCSCCWGLGPFFWLISSKSNVYDYGCCT